MANLKESVNFDLIRYANCWEDAEVLLEGLDLNTKSRVLSIASAGDNSLSLLSKSPEVVCAVDLSLPQLYLTEVKRTGFETLEYPDLLIFLGFQEGSPERRWKLYQALRPGLQESTRLYWDEKKQQIEDGIIKAGKFEKYFGFFSQWIMPLIHSRSTIDELLSPKSAAAQQAFYHQKWNSWRWRMFFRVFFGRTVMGRFGRDPEFLRQVELPVHQFIFEQAARHLTDPAATQNPMLQRILTGHYGTKLPHYIRPEQYQAIRQNLYALEIREGYADKVAESTPGFDRFNLSNIFEYLPEASFAEVSKRLLQAAPADARFAYWNLMAPRNMQEIWPDWVGGAQFIPSKPDDGFFYQAFRLDVRLATADSISKDLPFSAPA